MRVITKKEVNDLLWYISMHQTWQSDDYAAEMRNDMEEEEPGSVERIEALVEELWSEIR